MQRSRLVATDDHDRTRMAASAGCERGQWRRRAALLFAVLAVLFSVSCAKKEPTVVAQLFDRLDAIEETLREANGDQAAAEKSLRRLYQSRADEILAYRAGIEAAVEELTPKEQTRYHERLAEARSGIQNLARGFSKPVDLLAIVATML